MIQGFPLHGLMYSVRVRASIPIALLCTTAAIANVTINYNTVTRTLPTVYHGVNYVGFWDDIAGSTGSMNALKRAGVQLIRFPGGIPGDNYNWQAPGTNKGTNTQIPNYISVGNYAKSIGAKLLFQTNAEGAASSPSSSTNAANWVAACKTSNIDVPYWEIGNEPEYWTARQPGTYFDTFHVQAVAMKAKNPAITIMGAATNNAAIIGQLLQKYPADVDAISFHWYGGGGWTSVKSAAQDLWPNVASIIGGFNTTNKPFFVTEWSVLGAQLPDVANDFNKQIGSTLAYMDMVGAFTISNVSGYTMFGCIHGVQDNWGILCGAQDYDVPDAPGPSYFLFPLWTKMGEQVLSLTNTDDPKAVVSAYANRKASDGSVQVMLINKGAAKSVTVGFNQYNPTGATVQIYELKPSNGQVTSMDIVYNGVTNPTPATTDLPLPTTQSCTGTTFARSLPAYSATVLSFSGGHVNSKPLTPAATAPRFTVSRSFSDVRVSLGAELAAVDVKVSVCTVEGKRLAVLDRESSAGDCVWHAAGVSPGTYVVNVQTPSGSISRSVALGRP